jgi:hypothetical protein
MQSDKAWGQILEQDGGRHFYFADGKQISELDTGHPHGAEQDKIKNIAPGYFKQRGKADQKA